MAVEDDQQKKSVATASSSNTSDMDSGPSCSKELSCSQVSPDKSQSSDWLEMLHSTVTTLIAALDQKNSHDEDT